MTGYTPLYIAGNKTGLVQDREEMILPNDAYPVLENAYVWRERIKRKQGYQLLGRLRRIFSSAVVPIILGNTDGAGNFIGNIISILSLESSAEIEVGSVVVYVGGQTFTEPTIPNGTLSNGTGGTGTINYITGALTLITNPVLAVTQVTIDFNYFPSLPVMGLRTRELTATNNEQLIAFDQVYAYNYLGGWEEFIPGTTWTGNDSDFFWSTNYWVGAANKKIFWVTNFSQQGGDPIRYTNGNVWVDFAPKISGFAPNPDQFLTQCLAMLPFRGRMVVFNTLEGANLATSVAFPQRIRWAAIGNPFTTVSAAVSAVSADAWRDDIRGKGGFLDIPTAEDIVSVGYVRDNLVIYCERSTWQLRYTGRSIQPFQIEKVNTELGAESTFSAVQFDTSLVGIGDKGVVECDSFKSTRIDVKIPDLVFQFNNNSDGPKRVHGIRDFGKRLAYWTYPYKPDVRPGAVYPNKRLVYNYENDSWAIFTDSLTTLGTYQPQTSRRWSEYVSPPGTHIKAWQNQNYPWFDRPSGFPSIVGGNQQGFVEFLDEQNTNDVSLAIANITGNSPSVTLITSPNHNLDSGQVIQISDIPAGTPFATSLNDKIFGVSRVDANSFRIYLYSTSSQQFSDPQIDLPGVYAGGGRISIRDGFRIKSKKFNFLEEGQCIQLGYIDVLMDKTSAGAIALKVYLDYNDNTATNVLPDNINPQTQLPDTFFNSVVPTTEPRPMGVSKVWQRVFCNTRGSFLTVEWTLSNAQLNGVEQESDVQIDAQILWVRRAGTQLPIGL